MGKTLKSWVSLLISGSLIMLLAYTGIMKLWEHEDFLIKLLKSPLIPKRHIELISYAVPVFELLVVGLLVFKPRWGLYGSLMLLCSFTVYLVLLNRYTNYTGCSCGGIFNNLNYTTHLFVNLAFIIANVLAILMISAEKNMEE
ncbi:MAG: hypothetical protein SFU20_11540 [Chitinophagaceae bacterium]|nr:hypothetical protein [Chitinophagaceae bacterium]